MSGDKATKHGQECLKGQGSCYPEEQGRGIPGCRRYCIPWPGSWLQGSLFLPICQPVRMFCALYDVSVLKFRKRSKNSDREEGRKEGGREEGRKERGREGIGRWRERRMEKRFSSGSSWGEERWLFSWKAGQNCGPQRGSSPASLHRCELLSRQEQVLQDWKPSLLMHSFMLRNEKRLDSLHKLMSELI